MKDIKIKVCGMRDSQNIYDLASLNPDYIGFIFFEKSKRDASNSLLTEDLARLDNTIKKVGVFVNATREQIQNQISKYSLDLVQLHGSESPELCNDIKSRI